MQVCDFSRSFITFVTKGRTNNARIQVEAICALRDAEAGTTETFYLVASCKGEDTYGTDRLFLDPSYDFCMIYSNREFMILRTYADAERNNTTVGVTRDHFLDVRFDIRMTESDLLPDISAVIEATNAPRVLNGRTELASPDSRFRATLEYPVKTMNGNDIRGSYQVDTGPVLLPDFASSKTRPVERFHLAFVAFNRDDEAYFVIQEPTPVRDDARVSHYSRIVRTDARNALFALR